MAAVPNSDSVLHVHLSGLRLVVPVSLQTCIPIQHIPHTTKKSLAFTDNASISLAQTLLCAYTPPHTSQLGSFTYTQCGKTKTGNEIQASDCCQGDGSVVSAVIVHALINLGENEWKFIELSVYAE